MNTVVKVLAVAGSGAMVLLALLGLVAWQMVAAGFDSRSTPSALEERVARAARRDFLPRNYAELRNPVVLDATLKATAMAHWADHCAGCHSNDGSGSAAMGLALYPRPPDMRAAQTQSESDGLLYHSIENGIRLSGMPAWGKRGTEDNETWALVAFIRELPALSAGDLEAMKAMNPVSAAAVKAARAEDAFLNGENADPQKSP